MDQAPQSMIEPERSADGHGIPRRIVLNALGGIVVMGAWVLESCGRREQSSAHSGTASGREEPKKPAADAESIGTATMQADGSIVLNLRATGPGGMVGDGRVVYSPGDPHYQEVLRHLGGLRPGETKPVPPWPDEPKPVR